jgi:hypothetical protein
MVVEVAVSGRDRPGWWWGVMRGCSGHYGRSLVHAREAAAAADVGLGRKATGRGPRVNERADWLAGPVGRPQWGSGEGVPKGGEAGQERVVAQRDGRRERAGWAESWNRANSKKSFQIFFKFSIW